MHFSVGDLFKKKDTGTNQNSKDRQNLGYDDTPGPEAFFDASQFGMFILEDKPSDMEKAVDVVAIHGLNGHYLNSWTTTNAARQKVVWLRDLLPKQLPDARIMSYGYNSAVQFSKNVSGIATFAEQLLEDLRSWRSTQAEQDRPIVFICHSLGGIVVKQALIRAHERDRFSPLLSHVHGIAFFGTPHRGADLASWATMMGNILWVASFGRSTNTKFSTQLKSRSEVLDNISKSFVERGQRLKILSFYETEKMDNLNSLVVEKQSATLDWANEVTIALNATHRTICKFSSENEQRYRTVWSNLQEMIATVVTDKTLTEVETTCLSNLSISDYEGHRNRIDRPVPGTCTWILSHPKYKEWLDVQSSTILWVSANPGCGKSVLTSFLVEFQTINNPCATICYFFFKDDNDQQRKSNFAIAAILHQIYTAQPNLIRHAINWHQTKGISAPSDFSSLWRIFIDTIEDENSRDIICLIDALDECHSTSREEFMTALMTYFTLSSSRRSRPSSFKVLVTSRPDNAIKRAFQKLPRIRLRGEDEADSISRDVALVVQANINQIQDAGLPLGLLTTLQDQLIGGADRTFLWVTLIIQLLKDASETGASQNQLDAIVRSRDIDEVYNRLLQRSATPLKAKSMLKIIIAATRPLTLDELCVATALQWKHKTLRDLEKDLIYPFDNYIRTLCGHFLRIIQGRVYLVHQTAREFLLKSHSSKKFNGVATRPGTRVLVSGSEAKFGMAILESLVDDEFFYFDLRSENNSQASLRVLSHELKSKIVEEVEKALTEIKAEDYKKKISERLRRLIIEGPDEDDKLFENIKEMLDTARAEAIQRNFVQVKTEVKGTHEKLKPITLGFFEHSISPSEAHYYTLKACIHFLCMIPSDGGNYDSDEYQSSLESANTWINSMMGQFSTYAASSWPVHYSKSRDKHSMQTLQLCKNLCSPECPSFSFWTKHNELYHLKFPPGRMDVKGQFTDHTHEVWKTFLGLTFHVASDYEFILEDKDSDSDKQDSADIEADILPEEARQQKSHGQEHLRHSYRFREYRKAEKRLYEYNKSLNSGNYKPRSYLDPENEATGIWA